MLYLRLEVLLESLARASYNWKQHIFMQKHVSELGFELRSLVRALGLYSKDPGSSPSENNLFFNEESCFQLEDALASVSSQSANLGYSTVKY